MDLFSYKSNPEMLMVSPNGMEPFERYLSKDPEHLKEIIWKHRLNQFNDFTKKWAIFCPQSEVESVKYLLTNFTKTKDHFKYNLSNPDCFFISKDEKDSWINGLDSKLSGNNFEFAMCFVKNLDVESFLRHRFIELKIPSIVLRLPLGLSGDDLISGHKILSLMSCALGNNPWTIKQISETSPMMILGVDIKRIWPNKGAYTKASEQGACGLNQSIHINKNNVSYTSEMSGYDLEVQNNEELFVITVCYSWNKFFSKYLSKSEIFDNQDIFTNKSSSLKTKFEK